MENIGNLQFTKLECDKCLFMLVMENWIQWKKKEIANSKEKVASDTG